MTRKSQNLLQAVRKKRGYVLSYHRLLNAVSPALLAAYDEFYTQFTLTGRALTPVEKETVWIALIAATRARVGTLHLKRAVAAGIGKEEIADALALAAACEAIDALGFAAGAFPGWTDAKRLEKRYLRAFEAARGRLRPALAEIAAIVAHAGRGNAQGMRVHLARVSRTPAMRAKLAEGMTYVLLHCGGPAMVAAMDCWIDAARGKRAPNPF